ncbi:MAG: hypothetical protein ABIX12_05180 [Rubrivivax sp.]
MKIWTTPPRWRRGAVASLAATALVVVAALAARDGRAQAPPNPMSAPACQCSGATAVPGLQTSVVHCLCGGMSCVLAQAGAAVPVMQCVR